MKYGTKLDLLFYFTLIYLFLFSLYAVLNNNFEFLYYSIVISVLLIELVNYARKVYYPLEIVTGLVVFAMLHILGGNIYISEIKLYDYWLIEGVLKFDNFMHMLGSFLIGIAAYSLIKSHTGYLPKNLRWVSLVLIVMGVGAMNEILELIAVVFLDAGDKVGNYFNNAIDLVFNLIGSILSCYAIYWYNKLRLQF